MLAIGKEEEEEEEKESAEFLESQRLVICKILLLDARSW
jgi:hypothetical protein